MTTNLTLHGWQYETADAPTIPLALASAAMHNDGVLQPLAVAYSPDGRFIACTDMNQGHVRLYQVHERTILLLDTFTDVFTDYPRAITFSPDGTRLIVAATNDYRLMVLDIVDNVMVFHSFFGEYGESDGQFNSLADVVIDPTNTRLITLDRDTGRIQIFSIVGDTFTFLDVVGGIGSAYGTFNAPTGIAMNVDGTRLAVADMANHRIQIFEFSGNTLTFAYAFSHGVDPTPDPEYIAPYAVAFDYSGTRLVVSAHNNDTLNVFEVGSTSARLLFSYKPPFMPLGVACNTVNGYIAAVGAPETTIEIL